MLFSPAVGSQPRITSTRSRKQQRAALSHAPAAAHSEPPLGTAQPGPLRPRRSFPSPGSPAETEAVRGGWLVVNLHQEAVRVTPKARTWRWWPPAASKARCRSARTSLAGSRTPLPRAPAGPRVLTRGGLPAEPCRKLCACRTSAPLLGAAPITHSALRDPSVLPCWPGVTRSSLMCAQTPPAASLQPPHLQPQLPEHPQGKKERGESGEKEQEFGSPACPSI